MLPQRSLSSSSPIMVTKTRTALRTWKSQIRGQYTDESAVLSAQFALQESEEESNTGVDPLRRTLSDRERSGKKPIQTFDVVLQTSGSIPPRLHSILHPRRNLALQLAIQQADGSALFEEVEPVPLCILSTNERTAIIGAGSWLSKDGEEVLTNRSTTYCLSSSPWLFWYSCSCYFPPLSLACIHRSHIHIQTSCINNIVCDGLHYQSW
jgi:hypothetical protein